MLKLGVQSFRSNIGSVSRASGSVRFKQGETEVIAGVNGPTVAPLRKELYSRTTLEVFVFSKIEEQYSCLDSKISTSYRVIERKIKDALEHCINVSALPSTVIVVSIQIVNDDGSLLSCAMNGAVLALVDAGIPLSYTPCTCTIAISPSMKRKRNSDELEVMHLWPSFEQERKSLSKVTVTFPNSRMDAVVMISVDGYQFFDEEGMQRSIRMARRGALQFLSYARESLSHKFNYVKAS